MEQAIIKSAKTGKEYVLENFISYMLDQSVDIAADGFTFTIGDPKHEVSSKISAGDEFNFYVNEKLVLNGLIDTIDIVGSNSGSIIEISGRDKSSLLLDNDAMPTTLYRLNIKQYLEQRLKKYGFTKFEVSDSSIIDKIVIDPSQTEWGVIENICKKKGIYPRYDLDVLKCTSLRSDEKVDYNFSNDFDNTIKIKNYRISVSADVKNEILVYSTDYGRNHVVTSRDIKGSYKDSTFKINKRMVINDNELENTTEANKLAKEEFKSINKNAFSINIEVHTQVPLYINKVSRIQIKDIDLDCLMLINKVQYVKDRSGGSTTKIEFKLIQNVKVKWGNHNIPLIPR